MKRDLNQLSSTEYDLVIIGAGIYGAAAAWDASLRGLKVALVDKGDFGAATSANSLKTIHGGLRYLQQLDIKRMRESIRERRLFMQMAPHLVHPLPCVMPTYGHFMKGPEVMFAGLLMNDIISFDRNRLKDPEKKIPMGKILSKKRCMELAPGIDPARVNGGAFWTDAQVYNTERAALVFVKSAASNGADAANYVEATGFIRIGNSIQGIKVRDAFTGESFEIRGKMVLNTSGGWADKILQTLNGSSRRVQLSTAMNLVIRRKLFPECAAGVQGHFRYEREGRSHEGRRVLFMAPWRDYTIIGTFHHPYSGDPDAMHVSEQDVQSCLEETNSAIPQNPIKREDVSFFYKGFLPMDGIDPKNGEVILTKHYHIHDHQKEDGLTGLVSVAGVKYTTARDVAKKAVDLVCSKLGEKKPASTTHRERLNGGEIDCFNEFLAEAIRNKTDELTPESVRHLVCNYGSGMALLLKYPQEKKEWGGLIPGSKEVIKSEVIHAVREEMALKLSDVILRRTDLGSGEYPGDKAVQACAELMAGELNWSHKRIKQETEEVRSLYRTKG